MKKLMILVAGAVGYVLGTRAGRERYEQIRQAAQKVTNDPRVQAKTQQASDMARQHLGGSGGARAARTSQPPTTD